MMFSSKFTPIRTHALQILQDLTSFWIGLIRRHVCGVLIPRMQIGVWIVVFNGEFEFHSHQYAYIRETYASSGCNFARISDSVVARGELFRRSEFFDF
jgi:hypothetical protein